MTPTERVAMAKEELEAERQCVVILSELGICSARRVLVWLTSVLVEDRDRDSQVHKVRSMREKA